jgi:hypothetical protein
MIRDIQAFDLADLAAQLKDQYGRDVTLVNDEKMVIQHHALLSVALGSTVCSVFTFEQGGALKAVLLPWAYAIAVREFSK